MEYSGKTLQTFVVLISTCIVPKSLGSILLWLDKRLPNLNCQISTLALNPICNCGTRYRVGNKSRCPAICQLLSAQFCATKLECYLYMYVLVYVFPSLNQAAAGSQTTNSKQMLTQLSVDSRSWCCCSVCLLWLIVVVDIMRISCAWNATLTDKTPRTDWEEQSHGRGRSQGDLAATDMDTDTCRTPASGWAGCLVACRSAFLNNVVSFATWHATRTYAAKPQARTQEKDGKEKGHMWCWKRAGLVGFGCHVFPFCLLFCT